MSTIHKSGEFWFFSAPDLNDEQKQRFGELLRQYCERTGELLTVIAENAKIPYHTLHDWVSGHWMPDEIEPLYRLCAEIGLLDSKRSEDLQQLLKLFAQALKWEIDSAHLQKAFQTHKGLIPLDKDWLDAQEEKNRFGFYLAACLKQARYTEIKIAEELGVADASVRPWLDGRFKPSVNLLYKMADGMGLLLGRNDITLHGIHAKKLQRLLSLYDPTLNWEMEPNALQQAFKNTNGLLPLDRKWLEMQEPYKQFGLYLSACQAFMHDTPNQLSSKAGKSIPIIQSWKIGVRCPLKQEVIRSLADTFEKAKIPNFDREYFQELIMASAEAIRKRASWVKEKPHQSQYAMGMTIEKSAHEAGRGA